MTDYMRCGDLEGYNLEESRLMGVSSFSVNACDGSYSMAPMSPSFEMPGSPASVSSDCSYSTSSTEFMSAPASPAGLEDDGSMLVDKKPLKSNLRRPNAPSRCRRVTWAPTTVFETSPLRSKRSRSQTVEEDKCDEARENREEEAMMQGRYDAELCAPIPTKRAKIAELNSHAQVIHLVLPSICPSPTLPEPSRPIIPSFNFDACVHRDEQKMEMSACPAFASRPAVIAFSFSAPKRRAPVQSNLISTQAF